MTEINGELAKPVSTKERIKELDIVRGFALFGVLLVNMVMFNSTLYATAYGKIASYMPLSNPLELDLLSNRIAAMLIQVFAEGKFYTIFSFLFGLGFYIFIERAEAKTNSPKKLFLRRSIILFLFGVLHLVFVWYGDILHTYGLVAFILILFKNSKVKTVRNWIIILLTFSLLMIAGFVILNDFIELSNSGIFQETNLSMQLMAEESIEVYTNGSYGELVAYRVTKELPIILANLIGIAPKILGMFLIGLYVGKRKIHASLQEHKAFIGKSWKITGVVGWLSTIAYVLIQLNIIKLNPVVNNGVIHLFKEMATIFLSLFYMTSLVLLYQKVNFRKYLQPISYMGQMALTNYLIQCILCSLIFYGYGIGLAQRISITSIILLTLFIYFGQMLFSKAWLKKFQYGPFEWLWRYLTYKGSI